MDFAVSTAYFGMHMDERYIENVPVGSRMDSYSRGRIPHNVKLQPLRLMDTWTENCREHDSPKAKNAAIPSPAVELKNLCQEH